MDTDATRKVQRFIELWENGNTSPISWDLCKFGIQFPQAAFNAAAIVYTQESPENMVNFMEWAYKVADRLAACNAREDDAMLKAFIGAGDE